MTHPQVTLVEGDYTIDEELSLFTVTDTKRCRSPFNDVLYEKKKKDSFSHEQNLIIKEAQTVLKEKSFCIMWQKSIFLYVNSCFFVDV